MTVDPERARAFSKELTDRVEERLFGVGPALRLVVVGILTGNHVLIDDVPGVGKTTLVRILSNLLGLCLGHHVLVHEGGYRVELSGGLPTFYRPDGTRPSPPGREER